MQQNTRWMFFSRSTKVCKPIKAQLSSTIENQASDWLATSSYSCFVAFRSDRLAGAENDELPTEPLKIQCFWPMAPPIIRLHSTAGMLKQIHQHLTPPSPVWPDGQGPHPFGRQVSRGEPPHSQRCHFSATRSESCSAVSKRCDLPRDVQINHSQIVMYRDRGNRMKRLCNRESCSS